MMQKYLFIENQSLIFIIFYILNLLLKFPQKNAIKRALESAKQNLAHMPRGMPAPKVERLVSGRSGQPGSREISAECACGVHPPTWLILGPGTELWNLCSHPATLRHKTGLGPSATWKSGDPGTQTRYKGKVRTYH